MKRIPIIISQLIHIQGPMKGEIQEFSEPEISIGRHSSCHVRFPRDLAIISRKHARIVREGNRFKLIDESSNGTFLNGKRVKEALLKDGDVLIFADGGPKVSFLTKTVASQEDIPPFAKQSVAEKISYSDLRSISEKPPSPAFRHQAVPGAEIKIETAQVPLIIQYGPTLRSFKKLPITIAKSPDCDFIIDHPAILKHHAQIFYSQEKYWVRDLTGKNQITIDAIPIQVKSPLHQENRLSLSSSGPYFRFLGAGRLAEIEEPTPRESEMGSPKAENIVSKRESSDDSTKEPRRIFKKFFRS